MIEVDGSTRLTLVVTSRRLASVKDAIAHLDTYAQTLNRPALIEFDYLLFDQSNMVSVLGAAVELKQRYKHIDCLFLHSSHAGYVGVSVTNFLKEMTKDPIKAFTTGETMKIQEKSKIGADGLSIPFEANVFGPWFLINELIPVLEKGGRVIYFSSSISSPEYFSRDNIGLVDHDHAYEACKHEMECLQRGTYKWLLEQHGIETWLLHPGVFVSNQTIYATIALWMWVGVYVMFYICRWSGSKHHCIYPETAAYGPVWVALHADKNKDDMSVKYGSGSDRWGRPIIQRDSDEKDPEDIKAVCDYVEGLRKDWKVRLKDQVVPRKQF